MARNFARIYTRIWHDRDFRSLKVDAQHAYFAILSSPDLSHVGLADYFPQRVGGLASDGTKRRATAALAQLEEARFIVVDESTAEMCVRSLVRHDGVMDRVNMGKAAARAFGKVLSLDIRDALIDEFARLYRSDHALAGWGGFEEIDPDAFDLVMKTASRSETRM